jgi:AcrR family transcriptional regulator
MTIAEAKGTREKLLDAAERLFLEKGYDGVSIRDITDAAGTNVAAINYHFGGKENLYREFFRRMISNKSSHTIERLRDTVAEKSPPDLEKVFRAYIGGFLGEFLTSKDAQNFLRLASDEMSEQGIASDILVEEAATPCHTALKEAVLAARPNITEEKASLIIASVFGQMYHFVRARHVITHVSGKEYNDEFIKDIIDHIVEFSLKGIGDKND